MSNEGTVADPFAGLGDVGEAVLRDYASMLVKGNALSVTDVNTILVAKGFTPLQTNALDFAQSAKNGLLNDAQFVADYSRGDPRAIAKLYKADILITQSSGNLTDRGPDASEYDGLRREVGQHVSDETAFNTYSGELTSLASSIEMPPANAAAMAEQHFSAIKAVADMTAGERGQWGEQQAANFEAALGPDAEAQIAAASKILSAKSDKTLDLAKIVRTNGAAVATVLLFQAQSLNVNQRR